MKDMIKKVPVPLCGVILGCATLGNLLQSYGESIRYICGIMAALLLLLILLKLVCYPEMIKEDMNNPIMASVAATFPMSLMLLSTYVKPFIGRAAFYLWLIAIFLHIALILYFTKKFIVKLQRNKVFASYFIVYVGIAVAAITAPAYGQLGIGTAAFWFGFSALVILLVLVTVRYVKFKEIPDPAKPLICIYAAPASLCIAGYVQSVQPKSYSFLVGMYLAASILYVFALIKALGFLRLPFYPSYASFTFPFAISAVASKQTMACVSKMGNPLPILQYVVNIETIIAVIFVGYTLIRFIVFLTTAKKV